MNYKFKRVEEHGYVIIEDGHTMFPEDVLMRLKRLTYLEEERIKNRQTIHTLIVALNLQVVNIERWLDTGIPADAKESELIYNMMKDALNTGVKDTTNE